MGGASLEQLTSRLGEVESRLHFMHMLATHAYDMGVAGEWRALLAQPCYGAPGRLERHGYKVWSQNEEDGILVAPGDHAELAKALARLAVDRERLEQLRPRRLPRSVGDVVDDTLKTYASLLPSQAQRLPA